MIARIGSIFLLMVLGLGTAGCTCLGCPEDSVDGPGLSSQSPPTGAERGGLATLLDAVAAVDGPESPEYLAFDSALAGNRVVIGRLAPGPGQERFFGYVLLKDARVALEDEFARGVPPDASVLANPRAWELIPILFAAGHRLSSGGSWVESVNAAKAFAGRAGAKMRSGALSGLLPSGADAARLLPVIEGWPGR